MNKIQKVILNTSLAIIILLVAYGVASKIFDDISSCDRSRIASMECLIEARKINNGWQPVDIDAFDLDTTWYIWAFSVFLIMILSLLISNTNDSGKSKL